MRARCSCKCFCSLMDTYLLLKTGYCFLFEDRSSSIYSNTSAKQAQLCSLKTETAICVSTIIALRQKIIPLSGTTRFIVAYDSTSSDGEEFISSFVFNSCTAHSWRNNSFVDDIGQRCTPSDHPFSLCNSEAAAYGYPCEEYMVTTEDGYILSLKRIPYGISDGNNSTNITRQPVLLFHGLMVDSVSWLLGTPKQSLGFILADGGFDVWFANTRGTNSSRNHTSLSTNDPAYWDWTWDELAAYDLPAFLQFVYDHTGGQKVHYIGHSLGTLIILAAFSENKLLHLVRSAVLLCPIAYLHKTKSKLTRLATEVLLAEAFHFLGYREFNPVGPVTHEILLLICGDPEIDCYDLFSAVAGPDCCLNSSTVCAFWQHAPQSTSIKNLIHMSQMIRNERVRRFDYGNAKENMKHYNQPRPPLYNLSSIPTHVPMFLTHGGQDFLGDVPDTRHLLRTLVRNHDSDDMEVLYVPDYAHGDFVLGFNAPQLVYKPMVEFLQRH